MKRVDPGYVGTWRIKEMSSWDHDNTDEEAPAKLTIKAKGTGSLAFGHVQAELDCRMEDVGAAEHLAFTFAGTDEMDETSGRGWAVAIGKKLEGWLGFHLGEESSFVARKAKR